MSAVLLAGLDGLVVPLIMVLCGTLLEASAGELISLESRKGLVEIGLAVLLSETRLRKGFLDASEEGPRSTRTMSAILSIKRVLRRGSRKVSEMTNDRGTGKRTAVTGCKCSIPAKDAVCAIVVSLLFFPSEDTRCWPRRQETDTNARGWRMLSAYPAETQRPMRGSC
jgi:hypothetical protein